jgi:putative endonuclease
LETSHFVYIIYSRNHDKYYKGYSANPVKRLDQHNNQESKYTKNFCPWELVYIEKLSNKSEALKREKSLKKYSKKQIVDLCKLSKNILETFG